MCYVCDNNNGKGSEVTPQRRGEEAAMSIGRLYKYAFVITIFRLVGQPKHFLTKAHKNDNVPCYFFGVSIVGFTFAAPIPGVVLVLCSVFAGSVIFTALLCFAAVILGALPEDISAAVFVTGEATSAGAVFTGCMLRMTGAVTVWLAGFSAIKVRTA